MSAAKNEGEDGPDLNSEDDVVDGGEPSKNSALENPQKDELPTPTLSRSNGVIDGDDSDDSEFGEGLQTLGSEDSSPVGVSRLGHGRPSSADGSLSIPDDTPSAQGSVVSSSPGKGTRLSSYGRSPTPSLQPFDRRFQARASPSPFSSPRTSSPAFLNVHSRQSSVAFSLRDAGDGEPPQAPWEVVRWTRLKKMTGQSFSEVGKRSFGRPTCIAIAASIVMGTSKGIILVFDYNQDLKSIIGPGTKAIESGPITSISISADHSTIAAGHASGNIFTWEVAKSAKPFLHITPIDTSRTQSADGHILDVAILHISFLGKRHTALASADDQGMAFSHLATRGMGVVARSVKTTRILGRYPDKGSSTLPQRKPSSVLAFSSLPFGNSQHSTDPMGLVALLTPYLLVIVSTTPVAQTQYKAPRPREVAAHGAMTAALAWFPSVKLKTKDQAIPETSSLVKLVYCWSNILTVLEIVETESPKNGSKEEPPSLQFRPRSRWKAEEAIVGVQWLGRSVLAVLTITQQLVLLEDPSMVVTDSSDLIQKHIYHADLFSPQLNQLVDQLEDEEIAGMHGVVADAFYMSFKTYKGRLFLLGYNEVAFGTLSNWADRLLALMEEGTYIGAIQLATSYYSGSANKIAVGLPEDDFQRHNLVREKLTEMMTASLKYAFGRDKEGKAMRVDMQHIKELSVGCITACSSMLDYDFLFDEVYVHFQDGGFGSVFIECLEPFIIEDDITYIPPVVLKNLVSHYTTQGLNGRLEEIICHLDSQTMDIDQITTLCRSNHLYDALLYVWNQALGDYTTILLDLLNLAERQFNSPSEIDPMQQGSEMASVMKIFPYLSYILTSRIYPNGKTMADSSATRAKAGIYHFFFSGTSNADHLKTAGSPRSPNPASHANYRNLRRILDFDASNFLSMLNEAFEDSFLNGPQYRMVDETPGQLSEEQKFGLSVNRQCIVSILLEVMTPPNYESDDTIYLDMFIARNLPKFPQFILLPGYVLHRVLVGLCQPPSENYIDDCQLSVEYLLSMYQPPDMSLLIPLMSKARFYRVLKSIYKAEKQYAALLTTCLEDYDNTDAIFKCIGDCLKPGAGLSEQQRRDFRGVIEGHAYDLVAADVKKAAFTIDAYAPDLHSMLLVAISEDEAAQFTYLETVLERPNSNIEKETPPSRNRAFTEQFLRLLCKYNPTHVSNYIEQLDSGDLRLNEVLPALEDSHNVDAAVILMAREGKIQDGMFRLTKHLGTLASILLGLVDGVSESPDAGNTAQTGRDLINSIEKYARVGVWLCQRQMKAAVESKPGLARSKSAKSSNDPLSLSEQLWLDLIDSVVMVTKDVTEVLEIHEKQADDGEDEQPRTMNFLELEPSKMIVNLRTIVQETFTALLAATSARHAKGSHLTDISFLRILRSFLSRVALSSPSLSNLRAVLGAIFAAYSYEESLLSLTNQLLDKDLFVHVAEADTLRRRGWRPLGQVCQGCGKKVWGPGAGGYVWDAWQRKREERDNMDRNYRESTASRSSSREGKGKAVTRRDNQSAIMEVDAESGSGSADDGAGPVVIFSCRHMFHRACLDKVQDHEDPSVQDMISDGPDPDLACPLCTRSL